MVTYSSPSGTRSCFWTNLNKRGNRPDFENSETNLISFINVLNLQQLSLSFLGICRKLGTGSDGINLQVNYVVQSVILTTAAATLIFIISDSSVIGQIWSKYLLKRLDELVMALFLQGTTVCGTSRPPSPGSTGTSARSEETPATSPSLESLQGPLVSASRSETSLYDGEKKTTTKNWKEQLQKKKKNNLRRRVGIYQQLCFLWQRIVPNRIVPN